MMNKSDLAHVGLKLLGLSFMVNGCVSLVYQGTSIVFQMCSGTELPLHFIGTQFLAAAAGAAAQIMSGIVLFKQTKWILRRMDVQEQ